MSGAGGVNGLFLVLALLHAPGADRHVDFATDAARFLTDTRPARRPTDSRSSCIPWLPSNRTVFQGGCMSRPTVHRAGQGSDQI